MIEIRYNRRMGPQLARSKSVPGHNKFKVRRGGTGITSRSIRKTDTQHHPGDKILAKLYGTVLYANGSREVMTVGRLQENITKNPGSRRVK